jgi:hypothetical protein
MGHHHEPTVDYNKRFSLDDTTKKILLGIIAVGIVLILLGLITSMGGAPKQGGDSHHSSLQNATETIYSLVSGGEAHGEHGAHSGSEHRHSGPYWLVRNLASLLVNNMFFLCISALCLFFLAVKNVSNAGWYVGFMRVPESMAKFVLIPPVILILIFLAGKSYIYEWTIEEVVKNDPLNLLQNKTWWLSTGFFIVRNIVFFALWIFFMLQLTKLSLQEDEIGGQSLFKKRVSLSAAFIVLFALSFSAASWDWIMSIESHWFSTMFGVYVFASSWVTAIAFITLITIFLYSKGYLPHLNISHFHDLGRHMFGYTVFYMYIWFSQFLLIWYANIPEEGVYFHKRMTDYPLLFFSLIFINFLIPFLFLLRKGNLRHIPSLALMACVLIIGHWLDFNMMILPGILGSAGGIGATEIGFFLLFLGLFLIFTFNNLSKVPLVPKNHPYLKESLLHET